MIDNHPTARQRLDETRELLARASVIRSACDLDLLVFLHRHPRSLLTNEQLAAFVGYDMKRIAQAIDAFIGAGLLERTQNPNHAARMYLLVLNDPQGGGLTALLKLASTRQGRREILHLLAPSQTSSAQVSDIKIKRRLHAIA